MKDWRIHLTFGLFALGFIVINFRLLKIQVFQTDYYKALAEQQHWSYTELTAGRGRIFSQDGFPLVINIRNYLLYAEPKNIADAENAAGRIIPLIFPSENETMSDKERKDAEEQLKDKLSTGQAWVPIAHGLSPDQKQRIEDLKIEGLGFTPETDRFYPEGQLAAHLLGFLGSDETGNKRGYYGLEGYYDGDLRGRSGELAEELGATGETILSGGFREVAPNDGSDLVLTINRSIQFMVEEKLEKAVNQYGAKSGTVIIMDPKTGAVLASASFPAYNPARYNEVFQSGEEAANPADVLIPKSFLDPAISITYEPGSVMKAVTMAAALDTGLITPKTEFNDSGPLKVSDYYIHTWNNQYHGRENMVEVLQHSCNIGAAWVGLKLGAANLREYLIRFGLDTTTKIDLEGETTGITRSLLEWQAIDVATAAFGQGLTVTPIRLVSIFSAIANDGLMMRPYVITEIRHPKETIKLRPREERRVISSVSSKTLVDMLTAAVEGGEAKFYVLKRYLIAGKTGTAQIPKEGGYAKETNTTFVGFLSKAPKFVMLTKLEEPTASIYAAETAVPLWMEIAADLINFYGIPPDR